MLMIAGLLACGDDHELQGADAETVLAWDFERVIVSHGDNVERDGFPKYLPAA